MSPLALAALGKLAAVLSWGALLALAARHR